MGQSIIISIAITSKCPLGAIGSLGRTHFSKYKDGSRESGVDGDRPIQEVAPISQWGSFRGSLAISLGPLGRFLGVFWEHVGEGFEGHECTHRYLRRF